MDKLKDMLKISERDKRLLIVVMAVLIMALAYFFGYSNLSDQVDVLSNKKSSLELTKKDLKEKNNNKDKYIKDTSKFSKDYNTLLSKYEAGSTQPNTIEFFNNIEDVTGTWVKSITMSPKSSLYRFGQIASSNVSADNTASYATNQVGYRETINITYEGDYSQWKHFIRYINTYASKSTIDSLSANYNESTGVVSGSAVVSLYSIEGSDRKFTDPEFNVNTGADNIFSSK